MRRLAINLVLAACLSGAGGCTGSLADAMVYAPNRGDDPARLAAKKSGLDESARLHRVEVGPPQATISLFVLDPENEPARGTVFVLHGIWDRAAKLKGVGAALTQSGFRAVLVDLRGHGQSSGDWLTYGVVESRDMEQLADHLERQGDLIGPVGVFGTSYGGAVALQWAARDERVAAVVVVATFASMSEGARTFIRRFLPWFIVSDEKIAAAVSLAGEKAGFDPGEADPAGKIAGCTTPVLLIYGTSDGRIPVMHGERIDEAAPMSRLVIVENRDHNSIMRADATRREALTWFDLHLQD